ncbi:uncharacterized protein LOC119458018 [Dermacentor silvarum]|uniref:uncharacterized protein LOC119458018 n=1 Tax=Dermacentor silvarum TaxID=543639 RepID=UPI002100AC80|nr:uncharacterized protein LOC119458018 [Dermacentor silvarum]
MSGFKQIFKDNFALPNVSTFLRYLTAIAAISDNKHAHIYSSWHRLPIIVLDVVHCSSMQTQRAQSQVLSSCGRPRRSVPRSEEMAMQRNEEKVCMCPGNIPEVGRLLRPAQRLRLQDPPTR